MKRYDRSHKIDHRMKYYGITQLSRVDVDVCKYDPQPKCIEKLIKIPMAEPE